jgi:hypothetical protein
MFLRAVLVVDVILAIKDEIWYKIVKDRGCFLEAL